MQPIVLIALMVGACALAAKAEPVLPDSPLYPPNYTRASLDSPYLPALPQSQPRLQVPAPAALLATERPAPQVKRLPQQVRQPAQPAWRAPQPAPQVQQPVQQASAQRIRTAREGHLGGGFIEFLFGGTERSPHAIAPPDAMPPSAEPMPGPIEEIYAPSRTASVPAVRLIQPAPAMDARYLPAVVDYNGPERPGTIIINTRERFLYLVQEGGAAKRYGIGVGRPGFTWAGVHRVTSKREWPDWYPPDEMLKRQPYLPAFMPGGPDNPLGARALYLGSTLYRVHGSNEPWTIGRAVSSGCIRMRNQDVIDLYDRVGVGAKVVVI